MTPWHHGTKYISWPTVEAVRLLSFVFSLISSQSERSHLVINLGGNCFVPSSQLLPLQWTNSQRHLPETIIWQEVVPYNYLWFLQTRWVNNILTWHLAQFFVTLFCRKDGKVILLRQSWKSAAKKPNFDISHPPSLSDCLQPQQHKFNWYFWHYG